MATTKLLFFVVDKLAEPFASAIERVCVQSPPFRRVCVATARGYNILSQKRVSIFAEPTQEKLFVRLTEDQATRLGAELLGEGIVWSLGLATLAYQSSEDDEAEQKLEARISSLEAALRRERQSMGSPPPPLFIPG